MECYIRENLALQRESIILEPADCDGLWPELNGGFQCRKHAVFIIQVHREWAAAHYHCRLDGWRCCKAQSYKQVAIKTSISTFMMARE